MRSSTLFGIIGAVLLGLGVAVAAKATGLFTPPPPKVEPPPVLVLAAAGNLFEGACLQATDVRVRPARPEEVQALQRGELLPPLPQAAVRRFVKLSIEADQAVRRDHLEDLNAPPSLKERLTPGMEAVNLAVPKQHCAGGMIAVGDWVNVQLTTALADGQGSSTTATALIARNVRVVAKRNSLWPVNTPLGSDCPVNFTLELNPYRAALLNFAKEKGTLVLSPLSDANKRPLEALRAERLAQTGITQVSYVPGDQAEYRDEDGRVGAYLQGQYAVGEGDLMRIFQVKATEPPALEPEPVRVQHFVGVRPVGFTEFRGRQPVMEDGPTASRRRETTPTTQNGIASTQLASRTTTPTKVPAATTQSFSFQPPSATCNGCKSCRGTPTVNALTAGGQRKCGQK